MHFFCIYFLEHIILSAPVFKYNDYKKRQERNILLTNKSFYNLKGKSKKNKKFFFFFFK
jgi:serum/glucocorticoid-regulated kinase 2